MNTSAQPGDETWRFKVNGAAVALAISGETSLLAALRYDLGLKGTRIGCSEGHCGACTVLVDGAPMQSCTTPVWSVKDRDVRTIEDFDMQSHPGDIPAAFLAEQAAQCGYCTNGIVMTVAGLLDRTSPASRSEIIATLDERHLCRCGTQSRILRAIDRIIADRGRVRA